MRCGEEHGQEQEAKAEGALEIDTGAASRWCLFMHGLNGRVDACAIQIICLLIFKLFYERKSRKFLCSAEDLCMFLKRFISVLLYLQVCHVRLGHAGHPYQQA